MQKKVELGKEEIVHHFSCQHLPNHQGYEKKREGKRESVFEFLYGVTIMSWLNVLPLLYYDKMVSSLYLTLYVDWIKNNMS